MARPPLHLLALLPLAAPALSQGRVHVDADATGADDGTSWTDAFVDLQDALASGAAEVWVAEGVYVPGASGDAAASFHLRDGQVLFGGFAGGESSADERDPLAHPTLLSGDLDQDDPAPPVVEGTNAEHVVTAQGVGPATVLDGFVVRRGYAVFAWGSGMLVEGASPTVRACVFEHGLAAFAGAGAVLLADSGATFEGCTFRYNRVHAGSGGAVYATGASAPTFADCLFLGNECTNTTPEASGGALEHRASGLLTVLRCRFEGNVARTFYAAGDSPSLGGGLHLLFGELYAEGCVFHANRANYGGGLYTWQPSTLVDCLFTENVVVSHEVSPGNSGGDLGGGLMTHGFSPRTTAVVNSTFVGNRGGEGAGICAAGSHDVWLRNSILWENEATGDQVPLAKAQLTGDADIAFSCVQGLLTPVPGEDPPDPGDYPGSHEEDPRFADLAALDLHLVSGSPCVDAGEDAAVPGGVALDLDGAPRFQDDPATPDTGSGAAPVVDMGAYELGGGACPGPLTYCVAAPNSAGPGAHIGLDGSLSLGADDFTLLVAGAPPNQNGVFFYGHGQAQVPFGEGFRCVAGGIVRLPVVQADPAGAVSMTLDLAALPNPNGQITAGSTWSFQFWYRDPAGGGSGFNLSDAFEATFCE